MKSGNINFLEPFGPLQACNGTALHFAFYIAWTNQWRSLNFTYMHTTYI